ncbi:receptor-like serine/threonine-protein kinase SD1-8 isoform X1 [Bidens hawaiensis]|uniref:receptor-like serine/threonine-protein kinase SD1-8 isoform X1 n=1 Tax=Bidens hawaiensis TaxID=980011 RepID=UPI00404AF1F6
MKKLHYYDSTIIIFFFIFPIFSLAIVTITPTNPLNINQTLVSKNEVFELGFFDVGDNNRYVGIWYKQIEPRTYVWVANRDSPVNSSSGKLMISDKSGLIILNQAETAIWTLNLSLPTVNTVAELLDSGNFVLRLENDENPDNYLWESFKNPTDTLLPGMKLGWARKTGKNQFLRSWKTSMDPGSGDYYFKMNLDGFPEIFLSKGPEMKKVYRSGPWNGLRFSGVPEMKGVSLIEFEFENNNNEISYSFEMRDKLVYSRLIMTSSGSLKRFTWVESSGTWNEYWSAPRDQCDEYRKCGPWGICDANASPLCKCMKGFRSKNEQAWDLRDGSDGCVRSSKMECGSDGFLLMKNMKLPESSKGVVDQTLSLSQCGEICRRNCSCVAYANSNISGNGSGCVIWAVDLLDMRQYADSEGGQDLYVRAAASDLDRSPTVGISKNSSDNNVVKIVSIAVSTCVVLLILLILLYLWRKKMKRSVNSSIDRKDERSHEFMMNGGIIVASKRDYSGETTTDDFDLPLFDFTTLVIATKNFSNANKLGQGGFGCVYKGILMEGQVVAVKRLSRTSGQGIEELTNEVRLIAKLQHRNLVRLLGCCIEVEEKLLVYEYMENKSLNTFLFNKEKSPQLDWQKRFAIITGIARGLLYLHQDSRFRIIHRDLKASNILLDKEMNPKISDFGMARNFGGDQTEAETKKVVGTH